MKFYYNRNHEYKGKRCRINGNELFKEEQHSENAFSLSNEQRKERFGSISE